MFVSFRLLVVESILIAWAGMSYVRLPVGASRNEDFAPQRFYEGEPVTQTCEYQRRHYPDGP